jgi:Rrf2 family protein
MLSLTKRADYALLALSYLAAVQDDSQSLVNTREIAEQFELPVELLAKLLQTLARAGLVASHPGPTGGYRLLRDARTITVAEVVNLVDGPLSVLSCSNDKGDSCKQFSRCTIRDPLAALASRVNALLEEVTLAEISLPPRQDVPDTFEDFSRRRFAAALPVG